MVVGQRCRRWTDGPATTSYVVVCSPPATDGTNATDEANGTNETNGSNATNCTVALLPRPLPLKTGDRTKNVS